MSFRFSKHPTRRAVRLAKPRARSQQVTWAIAAISVLGVAVPTVVLRIFYDATYVETTIVALLLATNVLAIQGQLRLHSRSPKLAKLEQAIGNQATYRYFARVLDFEEKLSKLLRREGPGTELFLARLEQLRDARDWEQLAAGSFQLSADEEFYARRDLVERTRVSIDAVSYDETRFWQTVAGQNFLEAQQVARQTRGVVTRRFFLLKGPIDAELHKVLTDQHNALVEVYVVDEQSLLPTDWRDFNIYDGQVVRYRADHGRNAAGPAYKQTAVFSVLRGDIADYTQRIRSLEARARRWDPSSPPDPASRLPLTQGLEADPPA